MRGQLIEFDEYIAPNGSVFRLHDNVDKFVVSSAGEGLPPTELVTQSGPMQHGVTVVDYRLKPRTLQYVFMQKGSNRNEYWQNREDLLSTFAISNQVLDSDRKPGTLRKRLSNGKTRCIDVYLIQGPAFEATDNDNQNFFAFIETLRFYAPEPWFYDPTPTTVAWSYSVGNNLVFPITFPIMFGVSAIINSSLSIAYAGSWESFPTITITGPISGPFITNVTTGEVLHLNYTVAAGEVIYIRLPYGNKEVVNSSGADLQSVLSEDSDLAYFHLKPMTTNVLHVSGSGVTAGVTKIEVTYYTNYIGI